MFVYRSVKSICWSIPLFFAMRECVFTYVSFQTTICVWLSVRLPACLSVCLQCACLSVIVSELVVLMVRNRFQKESLDPWGRVTTYLLTTDIPIDLTTIDPNNMILKIGYELHPISFWPSAIWFPRMRLLYICNLGFLISITTPRAIDSYLRRSTRHFRCVSRHYVSPLWAAETRERTTNIPALPRPTIPQYLVYFIRPEIYSRLRHLRRCDRIIQMIILTSIKNIKGFRAGQEPHLKDYCTPRRVEFDWLKQQINAETLERGYG